MNYEQKEYMVSFCDEVLFVTRMTCGEVDVLKRELSKKSARYSVDEVKRITSEQAFEDLRIDIYDHAG